MRAGAPGDRGAALRWQRRCRYYARAGLALSHYDARAHLVVARRILDSLMPGWQQIGAVWLPLPHLLNMVPVQVDAWYRTGASAIAISVVSMAVGAWALASFIIRGLARSPAGAAAAALLLVNPNVLYLQSTPMTEPLLFGTTLLAMALTADWVDRGAPDWPLAAGLAARGRMHDAVRGVADLRPRCSLSRSRCFCDAARLLARRRWRSPGWRHTRRSRSRSSCSTADGRSAPGSSAAGSSLRRTTRSASHCWRGIRYEKGSIDSRVRLWCGRRTAAQL